MLKVERVSKWFMENFTEEVANKLNGDEQRFIMRMFNKMNKERGKRRSVKMLRYDVATGIATEIPTSETRWVRKLCPDMDKLTDYIVVDFDQDQKTGAKNNGAVFSLGIRINPDKIVCKESDLSFWQEAVRGKILRPFIQSPSQARTGSAVFMTHMIPDYSAQWKLSIHKVMGYVPDNMAIVKFLGGTGLSQSSSKEYGQVRFQVIEDYKAPLPNGEMYEYSDGWGFISYDIVKAISEREGLPYIPSAIQGRMRPAFKGMFVIKKDMPEGVDVLVTKSMVKIMLPEQDSATFEYCLFSKPAKELTTMCYQYIQATTLTGDQLKVFVNEHFARLNGILDNTEKAMKYLGMVARETGEETDMESAYDMELNSKVMEALDANPAVLHDPWIQQRLKSMMTRTILDMAVGRIPVKGGYYFIITEPEALEGREPLLKAGQAYLNGKTGKTACFRSPLIHRSEAQVIELVTSPALEKAYGHLKDLLILNVKDDALPRAGGADNDGDKFFVCFEEVVVASVETGLEAIVSEGKGKPSVTEVTYHAVVAHLARNAKASLVGYVTDLGTTWSDIYRTEQDAEKKAIYDGFIRTCRVLQGKIIDAPKTGEVVEVNEEVQTDLRPHWLGRTGKKLKVYHSVSPMGQLYDYVHMCFTKFMEMNSGVNHNLVLGILEQVSPEGYYAIFDKVQEYLTYYKREIAETLSLFPEDVRRTKEEDKELSNALGEISAKYSELMDSLTAITDPVTVAGVAYYLTYQSATHNGRKDSGYSFPWATCYEGLIEGLSRIAGSRFMLVPIKSLIETIPDKLTVEDELAFCGDTFVGVTKVDDGEYDTFNYNDKMYVKAPKTYTLSATVEPKSRFQITMVGVNPKIAKALVALVGYNVAIKRFEVKKGIIASGVFYQDKRIGKVADESLLEAVQMLDRDIRVLEVRPSSTGKSATMCFEIL